MKTKWLLLLPLLATVAVSGCRTVRAQGPIFGRVRFGLAQIDVPFGGKAV